jgi:hypothetical protein
MGAMLKKLGAKLLMATLWLVWSLVRRPGLVLPLAILGCMLTGRPVRYAYDRREVRRLAQRDEADDQRQDEDDRD